MGYYNESSEWCQFSVVTGTFLGCLCRKLSAPLQQVWVIGIFLCHSCRAAGQSPESFHLVLTQICQQILNGLPWNLMQMFVVLCDELGLKLWLSSVFCQNFTWSCAFCLFMIKYLQNKWHCHWPELYFVSRSSLENGSILIHQSKMVIIVKEYLLNISTTSTVRYPSFIHSGKKEGNLTVLICCWLLGIVKKEKARSYQQVFNKFFLRFLSSVRN